MSSGWLQCTHLSVSHTQACTYTILHPAVCYSAFALLMKNLQSAADKTKDDSMLVSMFLMLHFVPVAMFLICAVLLNLQQRYGDLRRAMSPTHVA